MVANAQVNAQLHTGVTEEGTQIAQSDDPLVVSFLNVSKRYKGLYALRNISLAIPQGELFGLLGPTGAGKTTFLKLALGFAQPDEGELKIFGSSDPAAMRERIGYLPEHPSYHGNFTGREYLRFHARLSRLQPRSAAAAVERAIEATGIGLFARKRIKLYTPELLQRLGLAVALVSAGSGYPALLVLDEPSAALNRGTQLAVRDLILECKKHGSTVVLASHRITEIERACTSVGILRGGRLMVNTEVQNNPRTIIVAVPRYGAAEAMPRLLAHLKNLHPFVTITGGQTETAPLVVSLPGGPTIMNAVGIKASALRALVDAGWDIISVYIERKDLESIYLQTLPPAPQGEESAARRMTAPLGALTGGLATGPLQLGAGANANAAMPQHLNGRNTRPLQPVEVSHLNFEEVVPAGRSPLQARPARKEEQ